MQGSTLLSAWLVLFLQFNLFLNIQHKTVKSLKQIDTRHSFIWLTSIYFNISEKNQCLLKFTPLLFANLLYQNYNLTQ